MIALLHQRWPYFHQSPRWCLQNHSQQLFHWVREDWRHKGHQLHSMQRPALGPVTSSQILVAWRFQWPLQFDFLHIASKHALLRFEKSCWKSKWGSSVPTLKLVRRWWRCMSAERLTVWMDLPAILNESLDALELSMELPNCHVSFISDFLFLAMSKEQCLRPLASKSVMFLVNKTNEHSESFNDSYWPVVSEAIRLLASHFGNVEYCCCGLRIEFPHMCYAEAITQHRNEHITNDLDAASWELAHIVGKEWFTVDLTLSSPEILRVLSLHLNWPIFETKSIIFLGSQALCR